MKPKTRHETYCPIASSGQCHWVDEQMMSVKTISWQKGFKGRVEVSGAKRVCVCLSFCALQYILAPFPLSLHLLRKQQSVSKRNRTVTGGTYTSVISRNCHVQSPWSVVDYIDRFLTLLQQYKMWKKFKYMKLQFPPNYM